MSWDEDEGEADLEERIHEAGRAEILCEVDQRTPARVKRICRTLRPIGSSGSLSSSVGFPSTPACFLNAVNAFSEP